jgi:hypothetical protein
MDQETLVPDGEVAKLDPFSRWLKGSFMLAWNLPVFQAKACAAAVGESVKGNEMPHGTVYRMMAPVDVQYRAILQTLVYPESSLAALSLMRGLIEAWAHFDYIWSDGRKGAPCRALALELGSLLDRKAMLENLPDDMLPGVASNRRIVESNIQVVEALRRELACRGGVRRYGSVDAQVNAIAQRPGLDWLLPMWRVQSETVHMGGSDWLFAEVSEGRNEIRFPSPAHRATWFQDAVVLYHNVAITALRILKSGTEPTSDADRTYAAAFAALYNDTDLREMIGS